MKIALVTGFTLIAVSVLLAVLIYDGRIRFNYPDKDEFPVWGIDISHHQGEINWDKLKEEDIDFVIIKATEGGDYTDPRFKDNWSNSKAQGYKTGAYHFYRLCKNGKEQAQNFIEVVPGNADDLPPAIDLEFGGNCKTEKSKEQIINEINDFLSILKAHYTKTPIIYVTKEFYDEFMIGELTEYPIWIRDIFWRPRLPDGRDWLIWQFANRGHLKGIDTYVDLNVLNGNSLERL